MSWNEFLEACKQWLDGRDEAVAAAYWEVRRKGGNTFHVLQYEDLAAQARRIAGAEYERRVPRPEWEGVPGFGNNARLRYVSEADLPPALRSDLVS